MIYCLLSQDKNVNLIKRMDQHDSQKSYTQKRNVMVVFIQQSAKMYEKFINQTMGKVGVSHPTLDQCCCFGRNYFFRGGRGVLQNTISLCQLRRQLRVQMKSTQGHNSCIRGLFWGLHCNALEKGFKTLNKLQFGRQTFLLLYCKGKTWLNKLRPLRVGGFGGGCNWPIF